MQAGRQIVRLGVHWDERASFTLAEDLCIRRLKFADELVAENQDLADEDPLAKIDADFELMSSAVTELQNRMMTLFGGEAAEQ